MEFYLAILFSFPGVHIYFYLVNTHFQDSTGLDPGSYSTAEDLVVLSEYLFKNYPLFAQIVAMPVYSLYLDDGTLHHKLINTNSLLGYSGVIGGKTGWTDMARGCFMTIKKSPQQGKYIINIVLGADDRFLEMKKLIDLPY